MSEDFYPFVDSGDPAPDNRHLTGKLDGIEQARDTETGEKVAYSTRIAVYDDMLSTPHVCVIEPADVRTYLEETTNTVYRCMREQGGSISLMVIREIVENFIHANFAEPIISILDGGNTIRIADQGPGIEDKERAFEFGVTSADRSKKRYIRGTGAGFPMVQQYLENVGGAVSIEDNLGQGTVVTVSMDPARVAEIEMNSQAGAAVRASQFSTRVNNMTQQMPLQASQQMPMNQNPSMSAAVQQQAAQQAGQQYPQRTAPTAHISTAPADAARAANATAMDTATDAGAKRGVGYTSALGNHARHEPGHAGPNVYAGHAHGRLSGLSTKRKSYGKLSTTTSSNGLSLYRKYHRANSCTDKNLCKRTRAASPWTHARCRKLRPHRPQPYVWQFCFDMVTRAGKTVQQRASDKTRPAFLPH